MKAVILAAGEGKRLEPLTNLRPKPMLPLANKPLLHHVMEAVVEAGFDEVVLVVGYKRQRIQSYFGDGDDWGIDVTYAIQEKQLGTGDALLQTEEYIDSDFVVLNGDRIVRASILERIVEERRSTATNQMAVTHAEEPELYGVVDLDEDGMVTRIREKPPKHEIASDLINAGIYAFGPDVFDAIRQTDTHGELELTDVLNQHLDAIPVAGVPYDHAWLDVSRPWDLITVNGRLLDRERTNATTSTSVHPTAVVSDNAVLGVNTTVHPNATILRGTAIGDNVHVGANATIQNSIVMADVTIQPGTVIRDAVIGENVRIGANSTVPGGRSDAILQGMVHEDVRFGGILGDNSTLEGSVTVAPGSFLGNGSTVELGATVTGRIEPNATIRRG